VPDCMGVLVKFWPGVERNLPIRTLSNILSPVRVPLLFFFRGLAVMKD